MKRVRSFISFLLCLCLLLLCTGTAFAADLSRNSAVQNKMKHCIITSFQTNRYADGRPLIVLLLGSKESFYWLDAIEFIRNQEIFGELDVDILFVTLPKSELRYTLWNTACEDVRSFIIDQAGTAVFPVIIDAASFGGYGGCLLTDLLQESDITVQELNLADACNSNCVHADWIREIAASGTQVNIWGTTAVNNISQNTREVIEELDGTENVFGTVLDCKHGNALYTAIHEYGLHAGLPKTAADE